VKQVRFRRNLWYFVFEDPNNIQKGLVSMRMFMQKYHCRKDKKDPHVIICDEEDFVAIMLACPQAVSEVVE